MQYENLEIANLRQELTDKETRVSELTKEVEELTENVSKYEHLVSQLLFNSNEE